MKAVKWVALAAVGYAGLVVALESTLGMLQPGSDDTVVITTSDGGGNTSDRVVSSLESDGKLYVAANHWPRAWYRAALATPKVRITRGDGPSVPYVAVPVEGAEYDRVTAEHALPAVMRFATGFPPRRLLRLDPE